MFCKSPTVAAAFTLLAFAKSTNVAGCSLVVALLSGLMATVVVFKLDATPVICVGLPSALVMFNAVVGALVFELLLAGVAFSALKFTALSGLLPTVIVVVFTLLNVTLSLVATVMVLPV